MISRENPEDSDGEFPVEEIDGVRSPPENRFWKLRWAPYTDEENDVHVQARNSGKPDDGKWHELILIKRSNTVQLAQQT
eukprot:COSAG05_NODE_7780_length_771_cov_0.677083_1_plen_79_part_00